MTIDEFQEKILRQTPSNFMAMNGAETGILGTSSGAHVMHELQHAAIEFAHGYKTAEYKDLKLARKQLTAKVLVAQTLDIMSEKSAEELLDEIAKLMKAYKEIK